MSKIFVLLVLSCMMTTGYLTTTCKRCWNLDSTECCTEKTTECEACMTLTENFNINHVIHNAVQQGCAIKELCDKCISVTTVNNFNIHVSSECGDGDSSNAKINFMKMCPKPYEPNQYQCPSCYVNGSTDGCESKDIVKCSGNQIQCLEYRGIIQLSSGVLLPISMKGCATEGVCEIQFVAAPGTKEIKRVLMECTAANVS